LYTLPYVCFSVCLLETAAVAHHERIGHTLPKSLTTRSPLVVDITATIDIRKWLYCVPYYSTGLACCQAFCALGTCKWGCLWGILIL